MHLIPLVYILSPRSGLVSVNMFETIYFERVYSSGSRFHNIFFFCVFVKIERNFISWLTFLPFELVQLANVVF